MSRFRELSQRVAKQNKEVYLFSQDTPEGIAGMIIEEAEELRKELLQIFVTGQAWKLAGEIGDILYLLIRMGQLSGIDPLDALELKIDRNYEKYAGEIDKGEARRKWETKGGDDRFIEETNHP